MSSQRDIQDTEYIPFSLHFTQSVSSSLSCMHFSKPQWLQTVVIDFSVSVGQQFC